MKSRHLYTTLSNKRFCNLNIDSIHTMGVYLQKLLYYRWEDRMDSLLPIIIVLLIAAVWMVAIRIDLRGKLFFEFGIFPSSLTKRQIAVEITRLCIEYRKSIDADKPDDAKLDRSVNCSVIFTQLYGESPFAVLGTTYEQIMFNKI